MVTEKPTMVSKVKKREPAKKTNEPFVLQPEKIPKIGCCGIREGRPSLYFSAEDTTYLAEKMGHAIVGKFSHSIPSPSQVQRMLEGIAFVKGHTWNYINAKHIIIQFEDIEDYAKMMNGPNGTPVWFIDHHPMRVFKWTPTFDSYFETPIAAVRCNVLAVPIHLFKVSSLYAIGSLLGNPIQLDQLTVNKTRLSFTRICVEIDITKPPTEEIVLDILGKETVLKVKWDKIPLYCRECKHVGHSSRDCHAFGRGEVTPKPAYYSKLRQQNYQPRQQHNTRGGGANGPPADPKNHQVQGKQGMAANVKPLQHGNKEAKQGNISGGHDTYDRPKSPTLSDFIPEGGFVRQGQKGKKGKQANNPEANVSRANSADKVMLESIRGSKQDLHQDFSSFTAEHTERRPQKQGEQSSLMESGLKIFEKPNYFKHLEQEEFVSVGEGSEDDMDEDPGPRDDGDREPKSLASILHAMKKAGEGPRNRGVHPFF